MEQIFTEPVLAEVQTLIEKVKAQREAFDALIEAKKTFSIKYKIDFDHLLIAIERAKIN